jgi:hypothetical protein
MSKGSDRKAGASRSPQNRRDVLKTIGAIGSVGIGMLGGAGAATAASGSKQEAFEMARETVGYLGTTSEFGDWREQGVRSPELFYAKTRSGSTSDGESGTVEYTPSAWVFPIENRGEDVGYIAIGAIRSDTPVLTYGKSKAPQRRLDSAMKVAKASGRSVHKRFLYHSGVQFGVETDDEKMIDLRGQSVTKLKSVGAENELRFTSSAKGGNAPDWSGDTDDEVYGVPDWTDTDLGGGGSTNIGTGRDSWAGWDGCVPIAVSMAIGFHEGIREWDDDERESLIDVLHKKMNTDYSGSTFWPDIDGGIEKYDSGQYSYNANNQQFNEKGNIKDSVGNDNPCVLNMMKGPYIKNSGDLGHAVTVVGYRTMSCGTFCSYTHHKVHNGYEKEPPDRVAHGNWSDAMVTRIKPK